MENIITVTLTHIKFPKTPDGQNDEITQKGPIQLESNDVESFWSNPSDHNSQKGLIQLESNDGYIYETFDLPWTDKSRRKVVFQILQLYEKDRDTWPKDNDFIPKATECGYFVDGRPSQERFKIIGHELYEKIFCTKELEKFLCSALKKNDMFNIIRLKTPQKGSFLQSCPWELLHDGTDFLFRPPHATVLVRHVAFEQTLPSLPLTKTLHVALVDPRPDMPKEFDSIPQEERGLLDGLSSDTFKVTYPARNTLNDLGRILRENHPQIVHIDAHGDFGWKCPNSECNKINYEDNCCRCGKEKGSDLHKQGYLAFLSEPENDGIEWVNGEELGRQLFDRNILLVVLSACHSGYISGKSTFNSVAGNLIRHGIPAVIAMQFSIATGASKEFIKGLYETLMKGESLAEAVFEASRDLDKESWYRPVLYLRTDNSNPAGQLFTTEASAIEQLREWKEMHNQSQELYFKIDPASVFLNKRMLDDASRQWNMCREPIKIFLRQDFQYIKSKTFDELKKETVADEIARQLNIIPQESEKIGELKNTIGDISSKFGALLAESDKKIKELVETLRA